MDMRLERKSTQALLAHMSADLAKLEQMEQVVASLLDEKMLVKHLLISTRKTD